MSTELRDWNGVVIPEFPEGTEVMIVNAEGRNVVPPRLSPADGGIWTLSAFDRDDANLPYRVERDDNRRKWVGEVALPFEPVTDDDLAFVRASLGLEV